MNAFKLIALVLALLICTCEVQAGWVAKYTVDNISTEYLPIRFTLRYEESTRPGIQLTKTSGIFNNGQSRSIELPSNSLKITFSL